MTQQTFSHLTDSTDFIMSKLSKQHHAIIEIPDIDSVFEEECDPLKEIEKILWYNCNYDCYFYDCGLCDENCGVHDEIRSIFDLIDKSCGLS